MFLVGFLESYVFKTLRGACGKCLAFNMTLRVFENEILHKA